MKAKPFNAPLTRPDPPSVGMLKTSWWIEPEYQTSREKFQARLVAKEITRMNSSRFGGTRRYHDSGLGESK